MILQALLAVVFGAVLPQVSEAHAQQEPQRRPLKQAKLPRPQQLGHGTELRRDPATGELRRVPASPRRRKHPAPGAESGASESAGWPGKPLRARVGLVEVGCNVLLPDGTPLRGLGRDAFRVFEDDIEQRIAHFDASNEPASIALVIDASPSVFRELDQMKAAARALAKKLLPLDQVAVVSFAGQPHLLLPFSRDRVLLERALASSWLTRVENSPESNIYQAVYLTARELFGGRPGRKAIVLLTDGQDSGLGLTWDPASAMPPAVETGSQTGARVNRLTFEDVARELAAVGVEVHVVSTQPRPRAMTEAWLEAHRSEMLVTPAARELGMAHYTLYLAELVRRVGGRLYFLSEIGDLSKVYSRIAENLGAQYTLGYYPSAGLSKPGWRKLRVELASSSEAPSASARSASGETRDAPPAPREATVVARGVHLTHRVAYYVPAEP